MKVSVSLPGEDVEFLDAYASAHDYSSRSAVVHQAIRAFRRGELHDAYRDAWDEWSRDESSAAWETTTDDGL
ncbi:MAG TPA: ribbon-helix-helix domain-containing protein [Solirubrobacteraceae bacterium]|jgi:Arc/MetJ-type ribon-helix-helix transcriptional regulator|nr:ribbon-helix-helix domain-containing protein [Solirubrobacteraceae bacterium]